MSPADSGPASPDIAAVVYEVHSHFDHDGVDHAFGGALALAYYVEPRGTVDVDVNVFVPFASAAAVVSGLEPVGFRPERPAVGWLPAAGVRLDRRTDRARLNLFFSLDARYEEMARRKKRFPFGQQRRELPFLSAEDLAVFKLSFGRDKDWVDLRMLVTAQPGLDLDYVERQLLGLRGPTMYPRLARLRMMARDVGR